MYMCVYMLQYTSMYVYLLSCTGSIIISDRFVILGNHRDAWVFGGVDPNSGTAALMELARTLAELRKIGIM